MHFNIMLTISLSYNTIVKRKEDNNRRRPFAGLMLVVLYFSKKAKALIIVGAVLAAIGFVGGSYFGSIVVTEVSQGSINQVASTPYPVNGIDPFLSEKILFGIGILGIAIIGLGIASRKRDKDNLAKLK
jgi:hypothetical protein